MTGHGGDGFLKFQDAEEIVNKELADAFEQMWQKRRYHEILFIIDTCQGEFNSCVGTEGGRQLYLIDSILELWRSRSFLPFS